MVSNEEITQALEKKRSNKTEVDDKFCHDCGVRNPKNAIFCQGCGIELYSGLKAELKEIRDEIKLSGLSPAESMYLLNNQSNILEMINVTFLDMINRNVLETASQEVLKGFLIKKEKTETFIQEGTAFGEILKPHEEVFQEAMDNKPELSLEKYTKKLFKKLGLFTYKQGLGKRRIDFSRYRSKKIRDPMVDMGYLEIYKTKSMGIVSRNNYELTDYGLTLKNKIDSLLEGENLEGYIKNDQTISYSWFNKRTSESENALGARIFLLSPEDEVKLHEFNKELSNVIGNRINRNSSTYNSPI